MKQVLSIVLTLLVTSNLFGQEEKVIPAYWVVETNMNQKNFSIVRLYDSNNVLVHEVRMNAVYFDITRPKHKKMLNELLKGYYHRPVLTSKRAKKKTLLRSI